MLLVGGLLLGGLLLSGCWSAGYWRAGWSASWSAGCGRQAASRCVGCWSAGDLVWFSLACFGGWLLSRLLSGGLSLVGGRPVGRLSLVGGRLSVGGLLVAGCDGTCGQLPPQKSKFSFYPRHAIRTVEGEISSCAAALLVRRAPPTHLPSRGKRGG